MQRKVTRGFGTRKRCDLICIFRGDFAGWRMPCNACVCLGVGGALFLQWLRQQRWEQGRSHGRGRQALVKGRADFGWRGGRCSGNGCLAPSRWQEKFTVTHAHLHHPVREAAVQPCSRRRWAQPGAETQLGSPAGQSPADSEFEPCGLTTTHHCPLGGACPAVRPRTMSHVSCPADHKRKVGG